MIWTYEDDQMNIMISLDHIDMVEINKPTDNYYTKWILRIRSRGSYGEYALDKATVDSFIEAYERNTQFIQGELSEREEWELRESIRDA